MTRWTAEAAQGGKVRLVNQALGDSAAYRFNDDRQRPLLVEDEISRRHGVLIIC